MNFQHIAKEIEDQLDLSKKESIIRQSEYDKKMALL